MIVQWSFFLMERVKKVLENLTKVSINQPHIQLMTIIRSEFRYKTNKKGDPDFEGMHSFITTTTREVKGK